jgi:hypothetical protein
VLSVLTAATLALPVALVRRRLVGTAETVAAVGLLLALLDAYLARRLDLAGLGALDGAGYAAGVLAVLAAGWVAYGRALPALRGPLPTALLLAQLPLPLAAVAASGGGRPVAAALIATAAADVALLRRARGATRIVGLAGGATVWTVGTLIALVYAYAPELDPAAVGILLAAGAVAIALRPVSDAAVALGVLAAAGGVVAVLRIALAGVDAGWLLATALVGTAVASERRSARSAACSGRPGCCSSSRRSAPPSP